MTPPVLLSFFLSAFFSLFAATQLSLSSIPAPSSRISRLLSRRYRCCFSNRRRVKTLSVLATRFFPLRELSFSAGTAVILGIIITPVAKGAPKLKRASQRTRDSGSRKGAVLHCFSTTSRYASFVNFFITVPGRRAASLYPHSRYISCYCLALSLSLFFPLAFIPRTRHRAVLLRRVSLPFSGRLLFFSHSHLAVAPSPVGSSE